MGEINLEETPQTPSEPVLIVPSGETPTTGEPRKKRIKTLAGRMNLPWFWKMLAQQSQTSPSSHQSSPKQPTQPTRKSHHLATQGFVTRSSSTKWGTPVIEEIVSSSKGSPTKNPETPAEPHVSHVLGSEQASTETSPLSKQTLPQALFLYARSLSNKALHPNRLKNPHPKRPKPRLPLHQNWRNFSKEEF